MSTHSSSLAWKIPWTEEPGGLQSMGPQNVSPDWATEHMVLLRKPEFTFSFLSPEFRDFYKKLLLGWNQIVLLQFSSVAQSCRTLCDPMNHRMPCLPVQHQLLESTQLQSFISSLEIPLQSLWLTLSFNFPFFPLPALLMLRQNIILPPPNKKHRNLVTLQLRNKKTHFLVFHFTSASYLN